MSGGNANVGVSATDISFDNLEAGETTQTEASMADKSEHDKAKASAEYTAALEARLAKLEARLESLEGLPFTSVNGPGSAQK